MANATGFYYSSMGVESRPITFDAHLIFMATKMIDMTGQKFNRLTAIKPSYYNEKKRIWVWEFKCDCGKTHFARGTDARTGHIKSCGCLRLDTLRAMTPYNFDDITGKIFYRLTVIKRVNRTTKNSSRWLCKCECGKYKEVDRGNLVTGQIQSCGCLNTEKRRARQKTHGMSGTRLYKVWSYMITRCYNEKCQHFSDYGGRGIKMSDEWRNDYMNFYHDMKDGYKRGLQLDRIDVNGNYCKENCRWVTGKQNSRNKRNTVYLTLDGERKPLAEWAEILNKDYHFVFERKDRIENGNYGILLRPRFDKNKMIIP